MGLLEQLAPLPDRAHCWQVSEQHGLESRGFPLYFPGPRSSYRIGGIEGSLIVSAAPNFMCGGIGAGTKYKIKMRTNLRAESFVAAERLGSKIHSELGALPTSR